jgi:hypothetical protein
MQSSMKSKIDTRPYPGKGGDTIIVTPVATDSIMYEMNSVLPNVNANALSTITIDTSDTSWWNTIIEFVSNNIIIIGIVSIVFIGILSWYLYNWYFDNSQVQNEQPLSEQPLTKEPVKPDADIVITDETEDTVNTPIIISSKDIEVENKMESPVVQPVVPPTSNDVEDVEDDYVSYASMGNPMGVTTAFDTFTTVFDNDSDVEDKEVNGNEVDVEDEEDEEVDDVNEDSEEEEDEDTITSVVEVMPPASNIRSLFGSTITPNNVVNKCIHIITKGERSGKPCGKDTTAGRNYCYTHNKK